MTQPNQDQTNFVHVHQTCDKCGGCIHECEHGVEVVTTTSATKDRAYIAAANQKNLLSFIKDPETIKKAVEGSMDKRIATQDQAVREFTKQEDLITKFSNILLTDDSLSVSKATLEELAALVYTICQKVELEARLDESKRARDCIMYDEGAIDKIDERIWELKNGTI